MALGDVIAIAAICLGPVAAILISLNHQSRKEKRQQKFNSFFGLAAFRDLVGIHPTFVYHLNTIDIVFHDCPKILTAWHKFYECLSSQPFDQVKARHLQLDLLYEIAQDLGYKNWKQTDMDKFYFPQGHWNSQIMGQETQAEFLTFLQNMNLAFHTQVQSSQNTQSSTPQQTDP